MGLWEVFGVSCGAEGLHTWDWSQTSGTLVGHQQSPLWPTSISAEISDEVDAIQLPNNACSREKHRDCWHSITCTTVRDIWSWKQFLEDTNVYINSIITSMPASPGRMQELKVHQEHDELCQAIIHYCKNEWPDKHLLPTPLKMYWQSCGNFTIVGGLLLMDSRIFIPSALRLDILSKLHDGHQGITRTRAQCPRNTSDSRTLAGVPHQCPTVGLKTPVPMSDRISKHSSTILLILTSENTAPLTMQDQYIPIKWGYFTREHCCDKLRRGRHFVTTAHLHCAGSSSRLWAVLLITGLCSPGPPQDKNSFPLSNMVVFVSYFIKLDSWVHVAYCGRHFTNIVS